MTDRDKKNHAALGKWMHMAWVDQENGDFMNSQFLYGALKERAIPCRGGKWLDGNLF